MNSLFCFSAGDLAGEPFCARWPYRFGIAGFFFRVPVLNEAFERLTAQRFCVELLRIQTDPPFRVESFRFQKTMTNTSLEANAFCLKSSLLACTGQAKRRVEV